MVWFGSTAGIGGRWRSARWLAVAMLASAVSAATGCDRTPTTSPSTVRVAVAASTATVIESLLPGDVATVHAAGSGVIAMQVRHGAPIDVVVLADSAWMEALDRDGLIVEGTRTTLAGNEAVMVTLDGEVTSTRSRPTRWVTADPATAPLGEAATRGWRSIGWTDEDLAAVLLVEDAAAAVRVLQSGDADAAVLYATDTRRLGDRWVVRRFPDPSAATVRCEAAIVRDAPAARAALARLCDDAARAAWRDAGFRIEDDAP